MSKEPITKGAALSMRELEPVARRDADAVREEAERRAFQIPDGRKRRKVGRTEPVSMRTFPHIKKALLDMADAENKTFTEIFEDAVERRQAAMKGNRS